MRGTTISLQRRRHNTQDMHVKHTILKREQPIPLAEQRRILAKVDQQRALVDELGTPLDASRATAKNLLETLFAELTAAKASSPGLAV